MIRTAECVTPKHPDKMCDRIADAILTEAIKQDPNARTAIEVCAGHGIVTVLGEMTTTAFVDVADIARRITDGIYILLSIKTRIETFSFLFLLCLLTTNLYPIHH